MFSPHFWLFLCSEEINSTFILQPLFLSAARRSQCYCRWSALKWWKPCKNRPHVIADDPRYRVMRFKFRYLCVLALPFNWRIMFRWCRQLNQFFTLSFSYSINLLAFISIFLDFFLFSMLSSLQIYIFFLLLLPLLGGRSSAAHCYYIQKTCFKCTHDYCLLYRSATIFFNFSVVPHSLSTTQKKSTQHKKIMWRRKLKLCEGDDYNHEYESAYIDDNLIELLKWFFMFDKRATKPRQSLHILR